MNCIFCKIVNGEIPAHKVFENDDLIAILDISQATKGHTLVIPKIHRDNLYHLDADLSEKIFRVLPEISNALKKAFNPIGLNVLINTEKPLQSVNHFHIHLLPRYENDGLVIKGVENQSNTSEEDYKNTKAAIIKALKE
ncbi:MAG: HIT family protein [Candidatus Izemoplasmatales bacterium]|jgi:histidine triad (HIT) family protein